MPFHKVKEFQEQVLGVKPQGKGLLDESVMSLSVEHLHEEIGEYIEAHQVKDFIGAIDAQIDLIYYAIGNLHKLGLTPEEMHKCFSAVHDCNMTKAKGVNAKRGDGIAPDAVKPTDWVGPEEAIAAVLSGGM